MERPNKKDYWHALMGEPVFKLTEYEDATEKYIDYLEAKSNNVDLSIVRLSLIEKPTNEIQIGWNFAMEALIAKIEIKDVTPITFSEFKIKLGLGE